MNEQLKEEIRDAIHDALGGALDCNRVWSAWGVGTMSEDDFSQVADDPARVEEITDAVLAALAATGKQQVGEEVEDERFPGGFADAIAYVNELEELAETLHAKVFGHESDGESGASTLLQMTIHQLDEKSEQVGEVQGDALVDTARRNIRQFISKASFSSSVDKQAALSCVDVLDAVIASRKPVGAQGIDLEDVLHKAVDLARGGSSAIAVVGWITSELLDGRDAGTGVS